MLLIDEIGTLLRIVYVYYIHLPCVQFIFYDIYMNCDIVQASLTCVN